MTLATLGVAAEFARAGVAANCLWPRTLIATDAVGNLLGGEAALERARTPQIMADAAVAILSRPSSACTGQCFIDDAVLSEAGIDALDQYRVGSADARLQLDIFVDDWA
jgi:citronellol/citronellal dehydrogenase